MDINNVFCVFSFFSIKNFFIFLGLHLHLDFENLFSKKVLNFYDNSDAS